MSIRDFRLLMISAMYENGGNVTHRHLDGHPGLWVYPFESQLGTRHVDDHLGTLFPRKYRWPEFLLDAVAEQDYDAIIDEECRVRARTPDVSKFRHVPFDFSDDERRRRFLERVAGAPRSRAGNVAAFLTATFEAWKDRRGTGAERVYVGYSPIVVVDAGRILSDLPAAHVLHVVRNPWSAYADTKKRPVPLSLQHYMTAWCLNQHHALLYRQAFPGRVHLVRVEDLMADPRGALAPVCGALGLEAHEALRRATWNGTELPEVYPWGTIRRATVEVNRTTAGELSAEERGAVRLWAGAYLEAFDYGRFVD